MRSKTTENRKSRLTSAEKRLHRIRCPQCGEKTHIEPAGTVYRRHIPGRIREVLVCNKYPTCDSYVAVNSKRHQYGVPANHELRQLRKRAHILQNEIVQKNS